MGLKRIDLNCDLGEHPESDLDLQIMPFISSCNIACGFHAGGPACIQRTIRLAIDHEVAIGAHPSFPDKENFGRKEMKLSPAEITAMVRYQVAATKGITEAMGAVFHHVKLHGALYHQAAQDETVAGAVAGAIASVAPEAIIYGPPNSWMEVGAGMFDLTFCAEAFADRTYENDLSLRSRIKTGAVIEERSKVLEQVGQLVLQQQISTYGGETKVMKAGTICLHSDTKGAVELARDIYLMLSDYGICIAPAK